MPRVALSRSHCFSTSRTPFSTACLDRLCCREGLPRTHLEKVSSRQLIGHALHNSHGALVEDLIGVPQLPIGGQQLPLACVPPRRAGHVSRSRLAHCRASLFVSTSDRQGSCTTPNWRPQAIFGPAAAPASLSLSAMGWYRLQTQVHATAAIRPEVLCWSKSLQRFVSCPGPEEYCQAHP